MTVAEDIAANLAAIPSLPCPHHEPGTPRGEPFPDRSTCLGREGQPCNNCVKRDTGRQAAFFQREMKQWAST